MMGESYLNFYRFQEKNKKRLSPQDNPPGLVGAFGPSLKRVEFRREGVKFKRKPGKNVER